MPVENKIGVKKEEVAKHFAGFSKSLKLYPDSYLPLIFNDPANPPEHLAYLCPLCLKNGLVAAKYPPVQVHIVLNKKAE